MRACIRPSQSCTGRSALVATHMDVVKTTEDTSGKLGAEGVPHTVLDLLFLTLRVHGSDRDALLTVHALTGGEVAGNKEVLLALGNVDTSVLVVLNGDSTGALAETSLAATGTTAAT